MRDSTMYPNPDVFYPERFMAESPGSDGARRIDPRQHVFGFGRRCGPPSRFPLEAFDLISVSVGARGPT